MSDTPLPGTPAAPDDALRARAAAALAPAYELREELGRGGMSVVYRAHDARLRRDVAIKVLPPELAFVAGVRARFLREAQTAAQLSHPHIVPIYDVADKDGVVWIVMALVDGETLGQRVAREGRLPHAEARRILADTADALAHAHTHGVVHRDVKPDNILLERATGRVLVTDFGIARAAEGDQRLTATGVAVGTPTYMSPEQAMGEHEVDGRSDIYSLGVVGWQLLAGAPPFEARNTPSLLLKHVSEAPPPLAPRAPDAPAGLVAAIEQAMRKRPDDRPATAAAFAAALRGPAAAAPAPAPAGLHGAVPRALVPPPLLDASDADVARQQRIADRERLAQRREAASLARPARPASSPTASRTEERVELPAWLREAYARESAGAAVARGATLRVAASDFRGTLRWAAVVMGLATVVSIAAGGPILLVPGVFFAARLTRRWRPLGDAGLSLGDVMRGRVALSDAQGAMPVRLAQESLAARARRFVRRTRVAAVSAVASVLSLAIGAPLGIEALMAPFLVGGALAVGTGAAALSTAGPMRRMGFSLRGLLRGTWRDEDAARLPEVARRLRDELMLELVPMDVIGGPYGDRLRNAADDRMAVRGQWARLDPDTAARLADVPATADELLARVAQLCQALHAIDRDIGEAGGGDLEGRVAELRRRGVGPDDQTLALLERQRVALAEFASRRTALVSQLDRAALALQNLRLDILRVRSAGQLGDGGTGQMATEQARAVSKDLAYLLDGVREAERL